MEQQMTEESFVLSSLAMAKARLEEENLRLRFQLAKLQPQTQEDVSGEDA